MVAIFQASALPISLGNRCFCTLPRALRGNPSTRTKARGNLKERSEEHTSELQSPCNLVCPLLPETTKPALDPRFWRAPPSAPPAERIPPDHASRGLEHLFFLQRQNPRLPPPPRRTDNNH